MAVPAKDTIYIDVDDEITGIIDKVQGADGKILALVLPKRAAVFQSVVNMKLLKRSADEAKKRLVLITSEASLLPLAGAVGLHVAKTLQSKPEIPVAPSMDDAAEETVAEDDADASAEITSATAGSRPVGELAGLPPSDDVETLELEDEEPEGEEAAAAAAPAIGAGAAAAKLKKNKRLRVPNFERFRLWLSLGILLVILLIVGAFLALTRLPKAEITIKTNASNVNASAGFTLDTTTANFDPTSKVVPAKLAKEAKTANQEVPATGQENKGDKAAGQVTMTTEECAPNLGETPKDVPAGTGVSNSGQTYITQDDAVFTFQTFSSGSCAEYSTDPIDIVAQSAGEKYNVDNVSFAVAGRSEVDATGSATGGTDDVVTVVSQSDIEAAEQKMTSSQSDNVKQDLVSQLQQTGYFAIKDTFNTGTPKITTSAKVGDEASKVTVTQTTTYTMLGAHADDIKQLLDTDIKSQINTAKQSILTEGLEDSSAKFTISNLSSTGAQVELQTIAVAGPDLNVDKIKREAAGHKSGDIQKLIQGTPGVTDVNVKMSPFWVTSAPKNLDRITVKIAKPAPAPNAGTP